MQKQKISNICFIYSNIGPTTWYGYPIKSLAAFFRPRYKNYYTKRWERKIIEFPVKLILIDGRFRVATFLTMVQENPASEFAIIFDDFLEREEYLEILNYFTPVEFSGSAAVFNIKRPIETDLGDLLRKYALDPR